MPATEQMHLSVNGGVACARAVRACPSGARTPARVRSGSRTPRTSGVMPETGEVGALASLVCGEIEWNLVSSHGDETLPVGEKPAPMRGVAVVASQAHNLEVAGSIPALATPEFVDGQILKTREICGAVPQTHPGDKESGMTGWKVQLENPTGAGKSGCQKGRSPSSSMEQRVKNGRVAPAFTGRFYDTAARRGSIPQLGAA